MRYECRVVQLGGISTSVFFMTYGSAAGVEDGLRMGWSSWFAILLQIAQFDTREIILMNL